VRPNRYRRSLHDFVSVNVQVPVAVVLIPERPTQGAALGAMTIARGPDTEVAVAAKVPVPETEHVGKSGMLPAATVKVVEVSCAPETVPVMVALIIRPSPTSMRMGPETLAPLWVAVQELMLQHCDESPGLLNLPVHVPARFRADAGAGAGLGEVGEELLPHAEIEVRQTLTNRARSHLEPMESPFLVGL